MCALKFVSTLAVLAVASAGHLGPQYFPPYTVNNGNAATHGTAYGGAHSPILSYENVNNGDGTYRFSYETVNGIAAHESGAPRAHGSGAVIAEGGFSYHAPDGQHVVLSYTADENGFHPSGSHIPTPPPIPEAILRSIEFNRHHKSGGGY